MRFIVFAFVVLVISSCSTNKEPHTFLDPGTYVYFLDKKVLPSGYYKLYVQQVGVEDRESRYWISFNPKQVNIEFYDNTWFDRLLKPENDLSKATVGRLVRGQWALRDDNYFEQIKGRKDLFKFLPTDNVLPKSNMQVQLKADDFRQCQPSKKPPLRKNGEPCLDRGKAVRLPISLWNEIVSVLLSNPELKEYYDRGSITPAMVAAAAHLETRFNPIIENKAEKELCLKGPCAPYKWGRGVGQFGANETRELWQVDWQAPQNHRDSFVRTFEQRSLKLLASCNQSEDIPSSCIKKFPEHIKNCREYEKRNGGVSHVYCFRPSFKMFATKMKKAFSNKTIVWKEKVESGVRQVVPYLIQSLIKEIANGNKKEQMATSARIRAGYVNRGAMINLSLQECVNRQDSLNCNYGNLSNVVGRRPASDQTLGTPVKEMGAQILKGEFINRCHIWYFAGLCGPVRENSLLDQYSKIYNSLKKKSHLSVL